MQGDGRNPNQKQVKKPFCKSRSRKNHIRGVPEPRPPMTFLIRQSKRGQKEIAKEKVFLFFMGRGQHVLSVRAVKNLKAKSQKNKKQTKNRKIKLKNPKPNKTKHKPIGRQCKNGKKQFEKHFKKAENENTVACCLTPPPPSSGKLSEPHTSTSICLPAKGRGGRRRIEGCATTRISLLELVLSGKVLCLTTFSSRSAKKKKGKPNEKPKLLHGKKQQRQQLLALDLTALAQRTHTRSVPLSLV